MKTSANLISKAVQRFKHVPLLRRIAASKFGRFSLGVLNGRYAMGSTFRAVVESQRKKGDSQTSVVLVSSNGAGLGHLTRLDAISRKLNSESIIYTLSKGYRRLGKKSEELVYFPSSKTLEINSQAWNSLLFNHFGALMSAINPKVIVFDGTYLYSGLVEVSQLLNIPLVWIRRGRWKKEVQLKSLQYNDPSKYCDLVVVPGEYAGTREFSSSNIVRTVDPVVVFEPEELHTRQAALQAFEMDPIKRFVLIQLGAGAINDIDEWVAVACKSVLNLGSDWVPVLLSNPLNSRQSTPKGVVLVEAFPASSYLRAFEFAVLASGYNSVQEAVAAEIPFITVPNLATATDDQSARASAIHEAGLGIRVDDLDGLSAAIETLASENARSMMSMVQRRQVPARGAEQIAQILEERYLQ